MMNIHPPLSAFPAVIATLLIIAELFFQFRQNEQLRGATKFLLVALLIATPIAYLSGFIGAEYALSPNATHRVAADAIETHRIAAQAALLLSVPMALFGLASRLPAATSATGNRKSRAFLRWTYLALVFAVWQLLMYVSSLGGALVFEHGAGVYLGLDV